MDEVKILHETLLLVFTNTIFEQTKIPVLIQSNFQQQFFLKVWIGTIEDCNNSCIGRARTQNGPSRSPDMNPLTSYSQGHLKAPVHTSPVVLVHDLRNTIIDKYHVTRTKPNIILD